MFLFFGINKQTMKKLGRIPEQVCSHCQKPSRRVLIKVIDWFTVFFIPLFPFMTRYALVCPLCDDTHEVGGEEMEELLKNVEPMEDEDAAPAADSAEAPEHWLFGGEAEKHELFGGASAKRYEGKNATQIAYLAKLEAREKEMEAEQEGEVQEMEAEQEGEAQETQAGQTEQSTEETQAGQTEQSPQETQAGQAEQSPQETQAGQAEQSPEQFRPEVRQATKPAPAPLPVQETQPSPEAYAYSLAAREKALEARESALAAREKALEAREGALAVREKALEARRAP